MFQRFDPAFRTALIDGLQGFERYEPVRDPAVVLKRAAVCITITDAGDDAAFVLTRRASRLRNHGGQWALPGPGKPFVMPPEYGSEGLMVWTHELIAWMAGLGAPLALGLVLLALGLALASYFLIRVVWRIYLVRAWHRRRQQHLAGRSST